MQTEPPPRANFCETVNQWIIYDSYVTYETAKVPFPVFFFYALYTCLELDGNRQNLAILLTGLVVELGSIQCMKALQCKAKAGLKLALLEGP